MIAASLPSIFKTGLSIDTLVSVAQFAVNYDKIDDSDGCSGDSDKKFAF